MGSILTSRRLDDFCDPVSQFWEPINHTQEHDEVDLTLCFQDTALLGIITVAFILLFAIRFICGRGNKPPIPFNLLTFLKIILTSVVTVLAVIDICYTVYEYSHDKESIAGFQFLTPIMIIIIMLLATVMIFFERKFGIRSSGIMTILWLALTIYGAIKLRSLILITLDNDNKIYHILLFVTFCLELLVYCIQFILVLIPEPIPKDMLLRNNDRVPCPEESATFLSRITWWWQNELFWKGFRASLEYDDLCDLNNGDKSYVIAPRFQKEWDKQLKRTGKTNPSNRVDNVAIKGGCRQKKPSVFFALVQTFGYGFFVAAIFKAGQDILLFVSPQLLSFMIQYVNDPDEADWRGYYYAVLMFLAAVVQSILVHQYFHRVFIIGMRIRTAIIAAVYRKALRLSNSARRTSTVGEIVNLMSVDAQRLLDSVTYLNTLWSAPFQILLALVFLYQTMGPSIFTGLGVMVFFIPLNAFMASFMKRFQTKKMKKNDMRIKMMNEVLNGMKVIKLYAWEMPFKKVVMNIRNEELKILKQFGIFSGVMMSMWSSVPFFVALVTFGTYVLLGNSLTAEKAFVGLSLFNILRFPLNMLPNVISSVVQANVSLKRLNEFLGNGELDFESINRSDQPPKHDDDDSISVSNGTFTWEEPSRPCLSGINMSIKPGELVAVVGQVGAGKSSLISALLGEMEKVEGDVSLNGSIAYVPQQAWIQNATVKENILFGKLLNGSLYDQTLHACALEPDLEILAAGDQTEIGEKGINLSGGQKQRISLARAVFQGADIYLLDDPLSAVDSHVGKHIFDKVIGPEGMLKGKVRILNTHGLGFLPQCDRIIVLVNGQITEVGTYTELIERDQAFAEYLRNYAANNNDNDESNNGDTKKDIPTKDSQNSTIIVSMDSPVITPKKKKSPPKKKQGKKKMFLKKKKTGSDDNVELIDYSSKSGLSEDQQDGSDSSDEGETDTDLFLDEDSKSSDEKDQKKKASLIDSEKVETGRVDFRVFFAYAKACTYTMTILALVFNLLTYSTSVGQNFWLAHWSNEETVSQNYTNVAVDLSVYAILGFGQIVLLLFATFIMILSAITGSRTLHNNMLSAILRSPMSFFDTTPMGRVLNRFSKDIYTIDEVLPMSLRFFIFTFFSVLGTILVISIASPWFLAIIIPLLVFYLLIQRFYVATSRQLKRLESVSRSPIYSHFQESITGASSIRAYEQTDRFMQMSEDKVDYNNISYYPSICANRWLAIRLEFIGNLVIFAAALFAALQRNYPDVLGRISPGLAGLSISYALQITQSLNWMVRMTSNLENDMVSAERTKEYSELQSEAPDVISNSSLPSDWPTQGKVQFDSYSTRYREDLGLVVKDLTADIDGGQKVGIVGRTGAGKSSLTLALFRIIESVHGAIIIDGIDIATIGLRDLRSRITIIPQDPVLFSGTLRFNVDPFNSYTDDEVWVALQTAHLSQFVGGLEEGLQHEISEGGENISVGQRQLVCLARALLRKSKILVLDEATAAVDMETDDLIQKTIRREFGDATVITIAHRLNTIMDYDRIMVLDNGSIAEFDSPNKLLEEKGVFYGMAKDAKLV